MHSIDLYYYSTSTHGYPETKRSEWLNIMDEGERTRFHRFKVEHARNEFGFSRWLLKTLLSRYTQQPAEAHTFSVNENGKPSLNHTPNSTFDSELAFNVSHCKSGIAIAIANHPVGVDLEKIQQRSPLWREAEDFLNPHLAPKVLNHPHNEESEHAFMRYWTALEAFVKLKGTTLYSLKANFGEGNFSMPRDGQYQWQNAQLYSRASGYGEQLTLASEAPDATLRYFEYDGESFTQASFL